ncbi:MAG: hypothetical protein WCR52_05750 [Bacteroidota bacterium]
MQQKFIRTFNVFTAIVLLSCTAISAQNLAPQADQPVSHSREEIMRMAMKPMKKTVGDVTMLAPEDLIRTKKTAYSLRHAILPFSLAFASGATWGAHEAISHHWGQVHDKFPNLNAGFWNPDESWKNKYNQRNPELGRNKTPIWFTDAKHMLASGNQVFMFGAGITLAMHGSNRPWWHYLVDAGISAIGYTAGNYVTYDCIFR